MLPAAGSLYVFAHLMSACFPISLLCIDTVARSKRGLRSHGSRSGRGVRLSKSGSGSRRVRFRDDLQSKVAVGLVKAAAPSNSSTPYLTPGPPGLPPGHRGAAVRRGASRALKPSSALKGTRLKAQQEADQGGNLASPRQQEASSSQQGAALESSALESSAPAPAAGGAGGPTSATAPCSLLHGGCESSSSCNPGWHSQQRAVSSGGCSPDPTQEDQHTSHRWSSGQAVQSPRPIATPPTGSSPLRVEQPPPQLGLSADGQVTDGMTGNSRSIEPALACTTQQQQEADSSEASWSIDTGMKTSRAGKTCYRGSLALCSLAPGMPQVCCCC
jgi:hypothetical protein